MKKIYENKDRDRLIEDINEELQNYQGYIQYSNRAISKKDDIFIKDNPKADEKGGFIYEAHFCNDEQSISIKQINDSWIVSTTQLSEIDNIEKDIQSYISDIKDCPKIKMAQIWEEEVDEFCDGMSVKKLKKVVFVGFEKEKK